MKALLPVILSPLIALTGFAWEPHGRQPVLGDTYSVFQEFVGKAGHPGIRGCTQWDFYGPKGNLGGMLGAWFKDGKAEAIIFGLNNPFSEQQIQTLLHEFSQNLNWEQSKESAGDQMNFSSLDYRYSAWVVDLGTTTHAICIAYTGWFREGHLSDQ